MRCFDPLSSLWQIIRHRLTTAHNDILIDREHTQGKLVLMPLRYPERDPASMKRDYERSRREAFLAYPTIPMPLLNMLPPGRVAFNLATEHVEERGYTDMPIVPLD